jgi:hypothetical protein
MPRSTRSAAEEHGERLAKKEAQAPVVEEGRIAVIGNGHPWLLWVLLCFIQPVS